jgi:hypothetical protein
VYNVRESLIKGACDGKESRCYGGQNTSYIEGHATSKFAKNCRSIEGETRNVLETKGNTGRGLLKLIISEHI